MTVPADRDRVERLFAAVREACTPALWSRGVELVRAGAVLRDRADGDEIRVRVRVPARTVFPVVRLYLDDADWECDCGASGPGCEHVAAAAIALRQADEPEAAGGEGGAPPRLVYRLGRTDAGLWFERGVETRDGFLAIEAPLGVAAKGRAGGPAVLATREDLTVEAALGARRRGLVEPPALRKLFAALARCPDVRLDGRPVRVSVRDLLPVVVVEDQGEGFRIALEDPPGITERLPGGVARCGDVLRPIGTPALTGREWDELTRGRSFPPGGAIEIVTEILPSLRDRVPIEVRTERLPATVDERPRIAIETAAEGDRLEVLATLVYGDPPRARVDGDRLVSLGGAVPRRDAERERGLVRRLGAVLGLAPGLRETFFGEAAVAFAERLEAWHEPVASEAARAFRRTAPLEARVRLDGDRLEVAFACLEPGPGGPVRRSADPAAVVRAWREGGSLVALEGGGWAPLPSDWLGRFGNRVADLIAARRADGTLPPSVLPDLARLAEALDLPPPPAFDRLRALVEDFDRLPPLEPPADLAATLRPYQRRGVDWLGFLREAGLGGLLADDMGLGKTLQALCAVRGRTLVVAPTSVVPNWVAEARRFRPALDVCVYHGAGRTLDPGAALTVTSYALLRLDREALAAGPWDTVVLDEAQAIKNPESQAAQAAFALDARFRIAMTGTPVENRLDELWSQLHFTNPGLLGGLSDFQRRYARPIAEGDAALAAHLRRRIRPFVLRRLKRDVAPELPPRTDVVLRCELTPEEREVYDAVRAASLEEVVRRLDSGGGVLAALEALLRLRQAACHPGLVPGQRSETSSKVELLVERLDNVAADGHKALVFSQWTSLLDRIEPPLRAAGVPFDRLDGATRDRAAVVARFQDDAGPPVLLISLRAGGTGLNLTAADHVFLVDPWWNPAVEDQAADRAHRIGQDKPVLVYRLVAIDTVEERILALQERKRALAEAATGVGAGVELTRDDLLALLG